MKAIEIGAPAQSLYGRNKPISVGLSESRASGRPTENTYVDVDVDDGWGSSEALPY